MKNCYLLTRENNQPKFVIVDFDQLNTIPYNYLVKNKANLLSNNEKFKQCFQFVFNNWENCPDIRQKDGRYFSVNKQKKFIGFNGVAIAKEKNKQRGKLVCAAIISSDKTDKDTSKRLGIIAIGPNGNVLFLSVEDYLTIKTKFDFWNLIEGNHIQVLAGENIPIIFSEKGEAVEKLKEENNSSSLDGIDYSVKFYENNKDNIPLYYYRDGRNIELVKIQSVDKKGYLKIDNNKIDDYKNKGFKIEVIDKIPYIIFAEKGYMVKYDKVTNKKHPDYGKIFSEPMKDLSIYKKLEKPIVQYKTYTCSNDFNGSPYYNSDIDGAGSIEFVDFKTDEEAINWYKKCNVRFKRLLKITIGLNGKREIIWLGSNYEDSSCGIIDEQKEDNKDKKEIEISFEINKDGIPKYKLVPDIQMSEEQLVENYPTIGVKE